MELPLRAGRGSSPTQAKQPTSSKIVLKLRYHDDPPTSSSLALHSTASLLRLRCHILSLQDGDPVCLVGCAPAPSEADTLLYRYLILLSRQGKVVRLPDPIEPTTTESANRDSFQRLAKWFTTLSPKDKAKIVKDVSQLVLARRTRMCNFIEYKGPVACFPSM